jgi:hypothetical protein
MIILSIDSENGLLYFFLGLGALILWYYLVRSAVKASEVVKNQEIIIHLMVQQYKKQGANEEELAKLTAEFEAIKG